MPSAQRGLCQLVRQQFSATALSHLSPPSGPSQSTQLKQQFLTSLLGLVPRLSAFTGINCFLLTDYVLELLNSGKAMCLLSTVAYRCSPSSETPSSHTIPRKSIKTNACLHELVCKHKLSQWKRASIWLLDEIKTISCS